MEELMSASQVQSFMRSIANDEQAVALKRFFKTAPGEYGYGDQFLGIKVPETRKVVARSRNLKLQEVGKLLESPWHEERLCGLLILVSQFGSFCSQKHINDKNDITKRDAILDFYLEHAQCANNWDLVDLSVYKIVGRWLLLPSRYDDLGKLAIVDSLATSENLWKQRMSVVCTMEPLRQGNASYTIRYAEWHMHHTHDLMHKAVGWLLREMGKRAGMDCLRDFLKIHAAEMPRTMLRYAIERMSGDEKKQWMSAS